MLPNLPRSSWLVFFLIFLCLFTYQCSLNNEFMMDDFSVLFAIPKGFENIPKALDFTDTTMYYRPVSNLMRLFSSTLFPTDPFYFHAFGLILFSIHVALIFFLIRALFKNTYVAFATAALYAVHPINGVAGNYSTGQEIALFAIWLDLSALLLAHYLDDGRKKSFYFGSIGFFILALLSQEVSLSFVFIPVLIVLQLRKTGSFGDAVKICLPYAAVAAVYVLFRAFLVTKIIERTVSYTQTMQVDIPVYLNSVFGLITWYLQQLVFPSEIVLAKTMLPQTSGFLLKVVILVLAVILAFVYFRRRWRGNPVLFGLLWFLSGFIPLFAVALIFSYGGFMVEPHWFFYSSIGFFIMVGFFAEYLFLAAKTFWPKTLVTLACLSCFYALFSVTQIYNGIWRTQKSYCQHWVSVSPHHYFPNFWLAKSYFREKNLDQAEYYFKRSFTGKKNDWYVYAGLGDIEAERGHYDKTKYYYQEALKLNPDEPRVQHNIKWIEENYTF